MKSVGSYQANQLIGREGIDAKMWPVMLLKLDAWLFLLLLVSKKVFMQDRRRRQASSKVDKELKLKKE